MTYLIQDSNQFRGTWKIGRVATASAGKDGKVRRVEVEYKNIKPTKSAQTYAGGGQVIVERPVQRLIVIVPKEDITEQN